MSEFRFPYSSANGNDLLYLDGPVIEVTLTAPLPLVSYLADHDLPPYAVVSGLALIDTGAAVSVVEETVMAELDIPYIDKILMQTAHGVADLQRYNASVSFAGIGLRNVPLILAPGGFIRTTTNAGPDVIMLIGRDLLRGLVVTYDGPNSTVMVRT